MLTPLPLHADSHDDARHDDVARRLVRRSVSVDGVGAFDGAAFSPIVGIDIVAISRIRASLDRFGDRFIDRLFTPAEADYARASPACRAERLAARFAAKEAVIKALGFGGQAIRWRDIEVIRRDDGGCVIALHDQAARRARQRRVGAIALSLSHDGDHAIAVVHAMRGRPRPLASSAVPYRVFPLTGTARR